MSRLAWMCGVIIACLAGAVSAASAQGLSGRWYGEGNQLRGYTQWLAVRRPDGAFLVEFREYRECALVFRQSQAGRWTYENGIYATTTTMIEGGRVYCYDSYALLRFEAAEMEYQHLEKGILFKARRVSDDFEWPPCDRDRLSSLGQLAAATV